MPRRYTLLVEDKKMADAVTKAEKLTKRFDKRTAALLDVSNPSLEQIDKIRKEGFRPEAVGCIISGNKKLLFLYKGEYKLWQLPQGGIENKEGVGQALVRELTEELGEEFISRCALPKDFVVSFEQISFPPAVCASQELDTDEGEKVPMKGKAYFFCLLNLEGEERLNIEKTEFDDHIWTSYDQAKFLAGQIYQKGKKRITLAVLEVLKKRGLIS